ncbi:uncharacterized protein LOC114282731 [Camellia sinensis]|uniref:uncharacterized protein LOC114282731 n=1 Tax=Camellia sinensis TaxID=4442 RepID=UPI001036C632|nr:uncharacterized protein LOC114282731 [Camellia sinensis]
MHNQTTTTTSRSTSRSLLHHHLHHHQRNFLIWSHHHSLVHQAMELLTGISCSRGLNSSFVPMPMPMPMPMSDQNTIFSSAFSLQEFKPTLNFSLDGLGMQETSGGRLLFPFEDLKQVSSTSDIEQGKEQGGDSTGYWNGVEAIHRVGGRRLHHEREKKRKEKKRNRGEAEKKGNGEAMEKSQTPQKIITTHPCSGQLASAGMAVVHHVVRDFLRILSAWFVVMVGRLSSKVKPCEFYIYIIVLYIYYT